MIQDESQQARGRSSTSASTRKITYWRKMKFPRNLQSYFILHGRVWKKRWSCSDMHPTDLGRSYEQEVSSVFTGTKQFKKSGQPKATCVQWSESLKRLVLAITLMPRSQTHINVMVFYVTWTAGHTPYTGHFITRTRTINKSSQRTQTHVLSCYFIRAKENMALVNAYMH